MTDNKSEGSTSVLSLLKNFIVITPDQQARIEVADDRVYERLATDYDGFVGHKLISTFEFDKDWSNWEKHPHGDEIVVLLSGSVTLIIERDSCQQTVQLDYAGTFAVVPRDSWHTATTNTLSKLLFITPGENTQHRPV
ncbi:cupin domain-containing protein [Alteromonas ponticola]|uniref:Cupin n=1 Tax=Alteromonas ponticola TaxID=2720613 RepID=A0ABX1QZ84_9ALTE|nr:cupin domain-containing protein [Alteromonas ponticola]NMH59538.1 cupin [Alteromonas ponticola]